MPVFWFFIFGGILLGISLILIRYIDQSRGGYKGTREMSTSTMGRPACAGKRRRDIRDMVRYDVEVISIYLFLFGGWVGVCVCVCVVVLAYFGVIVGMLLICGILQRIWKKNKHE